jgi:hypothetical protein
MGTKLILKIRVSDMTFYLVLERKVFYSLSLKGEGQGGSNNTWGEFHAILYLLTILSDFAGKYSPKRNRSF